VGSERVLPRHLVDYLAPVERRWYGDDPSQFVDIAVPSADSVGVVVSYHGGYWRAKYGLDLHDPILGHCVAQGWTVVNVEYRRVEPGGPGVWDEMSSDVIAAAELARQTSTGPLVALGHSAGGHLALWLAAQRRPPIDAVVALAPVTNLFLTDDLQLSDHATAQLFGTPAHGAPERYREASPIHLLPLGVPQLVVHGPRDEAVPYETAVEYVEAATQLGDDVTFVNPDAINHLDVIDPTHPVWREVDTFLDAQRPE